MSTLAGKVAIITGAAKGIGRACVDVFLREGAQVVMMDYNASIDSVARELPENRVRAHLGDVSAFDHCLAAVESAREAFGGVDIVVNNAGVQTFGGPDDTSEETWKQTVDINLKGPWLMAKAAIPAMFDRGQGAIVNISSVQGLASQKNVMAYSTSKHGLIGLTRAMAVDLAARGIRVNCVCPGTVDTPLVQNVISLDANPTRLEGILKQMHPVGRIAKPAEIAEVIAFLSCDRASFMTGSIVTVDGGLLSRLLGSPE